MVLDDGAVRLGGRCRVRDLVNVSESVGLELAGDPAGGDTPVTRTVLFDPLAALRPVPGAVLLGVGLAAQLVDVSAVLAEAATAGYAALVVRRGTNTVNYSTELPLAQGVNFG